MAWKKDVPSHDDDPITHTILLKELCEVLEHRELSPTRLDMYLTAVSLFPVTSLKSSLTSLYAQDPMPQHMPSPADLRGLVRRYTPQSNVREDTESLRWKRRYDVWQRGCFSDLALDAAFQMNDSELGVDAGTGPDEASYLPCQHHGCPGLVPWPTDRTDAGRMYCPHHQPSDQHGPPVTHAEKLEIAKGLTPSARAFLRTALPQLMQDIPVTDDERAAAARSSITSRPPAFRQTADGPGVNPSVFLNGTTEDANWIGAYTERRKLVASVGYRWSVSDSLWKHGKKTLTDEQIDTMDLSILEEYLHSH